jgi:hypothetical protein
MMFLGIKKLATDMRHATHPPDASGTVLFTAYLSPTFAIANPDEMIPADYLSVNSQVTYLLNFSN